MKNFRIGTISGIPIYLNATLVLFLPALAWLISRPAQIEVYAGLIEGLSASSIDAAALQSGQTPLVIGAAGAVGLMFGVLVHELGHSWMARRYDIHITSITLWIFGGMAHMEDLPEDWHIEFWVALAGPVTSVLLSILFLGGLQVTPASAPVLTFVVGWLAVVNLTLAVFNMIPAFPMDGGRILRALLARGQPYVNATKQAATVAKGFAILGAVFALTAGAPMLILIAMFVYVAASSESKATVLRDLLKGYTVRDLMRTDATSVRADDTVADVVEAAFERRTTAFPVVRGDGSLAGVVDLDDARAVAELDRSTTRVEDVMDDDPATIHPDTDAFEFLMALTEARTDRMLVVADGDLLGVVGAEDVTGTIEMLQRLGPRSPELPRADGFA
jgi:Zn-dependent protease/CBS domain-containing protein